MFTAKHIRLSGVESLYEGVRIEYISVNDIKASNATSALGQTTEEPQHHVVVHKEDGGTYCLYNGTVYAMNSKGATVSRWDLGASMEPKKKFVASLA